MADKQDKDWAKINKEDDARALDNAIREHGLKPGATWGDINKSSEERRKAYAELPEATRHAVDAKAAQLIPDNLKKQVNGIEDAVRGDMARSMRDGKGLSEAADIAAERLVLCRPTKPVELVLPEQVAKDVARALVERGFIKLDGVKGTGNNVETGSIAPQNKEELPDMKQQAEQQQGNPHKAKEGRAGKH